MVDAFYVKRIANNITEEIRDLYKDKLIDENKNNIWGQRPTFDEEKLLAFNKKLDVLEDYIEEAVVKALSKTGNFYFQSKYIYLSNDEACLNTDFEKAFIRTFGKSLVCFINTNLTLCVEGDYNSTTLSVKKLHNQTLKNIRQHTIENLDLNAEAVM